MQTPQIKSCNWAHTEITCARGHSWYCGFSRYPNSVFQGLGATHMPSGLHKLHFISPKKGQSRDVISWGLWNRTLRPFNKSRKGFIPSSSKQNCQQGVMHHLVRTLKLLQLPVVQERICWAYQGQWSMLCSLQQEQSRYSWNSLLSGYLLRGAHVEIYWHMF
jgi:hypothetical protein